ncbi:hypothetical protein ABKN59_002414 [Abortiporus biennis]
MKAFTSLFSAALLVASALGQQLTINTPASVVVCQPILLTFSGGTPPYIIVRNWLFCVFPPAYSDAISCILPGATPNGTPLEQFTGITGTSFTWTVNQPGGTSVSLTLRDSTGAAAQSAPFDVGTAADSSCLTSSASTGASTTGSTPATTASGTTSTPATTPSTTVSSTPVTTPSTTAVSTPVTTPSTAATSTRPSTSAASTSGSSSASPSATGGASGALANAASLGAVGFVGAVVAAIMA